MNLFALILAILPMDAHLIRETVCVAERNHVFDCDGKPVLTQWIFYSDAGWILAWKMDRDNSRAYHPDSLTWEDEGKLRRITAESWVESFSQHDIEMAQREQLPSDQRRGLRR